MTEHCQEGQCPILADHEYHPNIAVFPSTVVCSGHTPFPQLPAGPFTDPQVTDLPLYEAQKTE